MLNSGWIVLGLLVCWIVATSGGCSRARSDSAAGDPAVIAHDAKRPTAARIAAVDEVWARLEAGEMERGAAREQLKRIIWKSGAPEELRLHALARLLSDATPEGEADTLNMIRLRLPTETGWKVLGAMCDAIVTRADREGAKMTAANLVRSYARRVPEPADPDRPERRALVALYPGDRLEAAVLKVFSDPAGTGGAPFIEKVRPAAWDLLARIDPDGSGRLGLLSVLGAAWGAADDPLATARRAVADFGVVPVTGSELTWIDGLRSESDAANAGWWAEARAAVQSLQPEQRAGMQLRHLEPIRWAGTHRPEWLRSGREELVSELRVRLACRARHQPAADGTGESGERGRRGGRGDLASAEADLCWGDLLTILVIDDALLEPAVVDDLFEQAAADRADTSTEYGGVIFPEDSRRSGNSAGGLFRVQGFQPRAAERKDDRTFIAPDEMLRHTGRSLAHYHFHVQSSTNGEYAGPGAGDHEYARLHARNCLVFTSIRAGVMNVDYYQRAGALDERGREQLSGPVVDLGEIVRAAKK